MRLSPSIVGENRSRPGAGIMRVERVAGRSAITSVQASNPLKILTPCSRGTSVWACLGSYGGGLIGGDTTSMKLDLDPQTCCYLTTQASTKVYRNPEAKTCGHTFEADLGTESTLVYLPDAVQLFAGSNYEQRQTIRMCAGSNLILIDVVAGGRSAMGEHWDFRRYSSRTEIFLGGDRIFFDSLLLDPRDGTLSGKSRMGKFSCLAMAVIVGKSLEAMVTTCLESISKRSIASSSDLLIGASPIGHGALVRVAGKSMESVGNELRQLLSHVPQLLGDDPWIRKW